MINKKKEKEKKAKVQSQEEIVVEAKKAVEVLLLKKVEDQVKKVAETLV